MAQACQWPDPTPPGAPDCGPHTFSLGGVIAGVRETTPEDPIHPALVLIVDVGGDYARIVVPPAVWPSACDLLPIGQRVRVVCETDSHIFVHGSRQVATEMSLVVQLH